jgi:hypothetical protein
MVKKIAAVSTPEELVLYAGRLMMNTAAVGVFMHDVLGMEGTGINPMNTMNITGGPWFAAGAQAYAGLTSYNATLKSKAKSVWNAADIMVPYYTMGKHTYKAFEAWSSGEAMLGAVHAFGATPTSGDDDYVDMDNILRGGLELVYGSRGTTKYPYKEEWQ